MASVNAALEPLKVLKVLIEGLPATARTGLWLTNFKGVPVARTLSPFDLLYLDKENRVLHGVELSKDGEFAPFRGRPASALVLPSHSLKASQTREGDQLELQPIAGEPEPAEETAPEPSTPANEAPAVVAAQSAPAAPEPSPSARFFSSLPPRETPIPVEPISTVSEAATQPETSSGEAAGARFDSPFAQAPEAPPAKAVPIEPATTHDFFTPTKRVPPPLPQGPYSSFPELESIKPPEPPEIPPSDTSLQISQPVRRSQIAQSAGVPAPLPIQEAAAAPAAPARGYGSPPNRKYSWKVRLLRWLFPHLVIEEEGGDIDRRRADRHTLPGLVAYFFTGGSPEPQRIANISVMGFYLETDERWMPGTVVRMTLQRQGSKGDDPADTITVNSRIVRWGSDGEGFEFILTDLEE